MDQQAAFAELERVIESLEAHAGRCNKGVLNKREVDQAIQTAHAKVAGLLPADSDVHRIYERAVNPNPQNSWRQVPLAGEDLAWAVSSDCARLEERIALLRRVINEIEPEFLRAEPRDKDQFYFSAGDAYRSKKQVFGIMQKASDRLVIVDQFLDAEVFNYIESLDPKLPIHLLTRARQKIFRSLFNALKAERPGLEARSFSGCHDRFIVIDQGEVWHLGASFNGFGQNAFMFNKVVDETERTRFLSDFSEWWENGEDFSD